VKPPIPRATADDARKSEYPAGSPKQDFFPAVLYPRYRGFPDVCIRTKYSPVYRTMHGMVKTRVSQGANGQYKVTVPKGIADALDLDGKRVEWSVVSGSKLEAKIVDD